MRKKKKKQDCSSCPLQDLGLKNYSHKSQINLFLNFAKWKNIFKNALGDINYFTVFEMENKYSQYMFRYVDLFICEE